MERAPEDAQGVLDLVSGQAVRRLAVLGIVISTTACDNVDWGGTSIHLVPPPAAVVGAASDSTRDEQDRGTVLPDGPVLYEATRDSSGVHLVPVGEIEGDSLDPFRDEKSAPGYRGAFAREQMAAGTRFTLFSAGVRVGTFTARVVGTDESFCTPRPSAEGVVELVPGAADATHFLALPERFTDSTAYAPYQPLETDRVQRAAGIGLAAEVIPQIGATWPSSMVEARADMQGFQQADGAAAVSTTFVFRDQVKIQPAEPRSYSLYLLATLEGEQYQTAYVWYREAGREGKGVPRYFQHLDWNGDGRTEILLEVLGERHRWNAVVQRRGNAWTRTFEDPCGAAAPKVLERATR